MKSSSAQTSLTWGDLEEVAQKQILYWHFKGVLNRRRREKYQATSKISSFPLETPNDILHGCCQVRNHPGLRRGRGNSAQGCKLQVRLLSNKPAENSKLVHKGPQHLLMVRVLPKLTCRHCNKTFSRKSTLDQHLVSHSSERWADVQVDQFFSSKIKSSPFLSGCSNQRPRAGHCLQWGANVLGREEEYWGQSAADSGWGGGGGDLPTAWCEGGEQGEAEGEGWWWPQMHQVREIFWSSISFEQVMSQHKNTAKFV